MSKLVKYSLPRHSVLAKQSTRFGAAIVDVAICLIFTLILFYGCFNLIFSNSITNANYSTLTSWEVYSHLVYYDKDTQTTKIYSSTEDYLVYQTPVKYFYLNYLTGQDIEIPEGGDASHPEYYCSKQYNQELTIDGKKVLPKDYYNIAWYNENVLGINVSDPDSETSSTYFTYQKDEQGNYLKDVLGIPKTSRYDPDKSLVSEITKTNLASYYKEKYQDAYSNYSNLDFVYSLKSQTNFINTISFTLSTALAGIINYVVIPLFFANGETFGKKIFKLGLMNIDGYKYHKPQLLLRIIPFLLVLLFISIIPSRTFYFSYIVATTIFLCSFAVTMASPKKCSLHDYLARTIVIDIKSSIIFDNPIVEEEYLKKEDGLEEEIITGEEPPLRYEK